MRINLANNSQRAPQASALLTLTALMLAACQTAGAPEPESQSAEAAIPAVVNEEFVATEAEVVQLAFDSATLPEQDLPPGAETAPDAEAFEAVAPADILDRIRAGYTLNADFSDSVQARTRIARQFDWYQSHPEYMQRVMTRAQPYMYHIVSSLEARGMPLELALLPIVESAFDPFAYSHGRAAGLWQFIPGTGKRFRLKQNWWYDGRRDVADSTRAALDYLEMLAARFDGDWLLAVAAYNSGEGNVDRALRKNRRAGRPTDFWHLPLPAETRAYVPKLLALRELLRDPASYGLELPAIADIRYFEVVETAGQIDLALAADLAGLDLNELYSLNPGFNRWATDPDGPHRLLVPVAAAGPLRDALSGLPESERVRWKRHRIADGETLSGIADRYSTTVALVREVNHIRGHQIRAGTDLMIPTASRSLATYSKSEDGRLASLRQTRRSGSRTVYVVRPGDSFWKIARDHGVGIRALAGWNGMAPRDTLSVGRELVIWGGRSEQPTTTLASSAGNRTLRRISYTVRSGDSFYRISGRFNVSVSELRKWNKAAARQKYLRPGQKLTLYVDVTRQSG